MGVTTTGFFIAAVFLVVGCFLDAIPAIIIVGTILQPLAQGVGMDPVQFAIIGIVSLAFGLVTPPYGLCLMIACSVAGVCDLRDAWCSRIVFPGLPLIMLRPDPDAAGAGFPRRTRYHGKTRVKAPPRRPDMTSEDTRWARHRKTSACADCRASVSGGGSQARGPWRRCWAGCHCNLPVPPKARC
jgi:hypothetical protein